MLAKHHVTSFYRFLEEEHCPLYDVPIALKLQWLLQTLNGAHRLSRGSFERCVRFLETFGCTDDVEGERHRAILNAFAKRVRQRRVLAPQGPPCAAMPVQAFKDLTGTFVGGNKRCRIPRFRLRTQLKLAWSSGLRLRELRATRQSWLQAHRHGYALEVQGPHPWAHRVLTIPRLKDSSICAVAELDRWLQVLPSDTDGFLFPRTDSYGTFHRDNQPFVETRMADTMHEQLRRLGYSRYRYSSIRIAFIRRCYERLGEAAAFYLSGYRQLESLRMALRAETSFITFPTSLEDL